MGLGLRDACKPTWKTIESSSINPINEDSGRQSDGTCCDVLCTKVFTMFQAKWAVEAGIEYRRSNVTKSIWPISEALGENEKAHYKRCNKRRDKGAVG